MAINQDETETTNNEKDWAQASAISVTDSFWSQSFLLPRFRFVHVRKEAAEKIVPNFVRVKQKPLVQVLPHIFLSIFHIRSVKTRPFSGIYQEKQQRKSSRIQAAK